MRNRAAMTAFISKIRPHAAAVRTYEDDSILVKLRGGDDVVVYLIDDEEMLLPTPLKKIVLKNTKSHIHTLFVLAQDVLPAPGGMFSRMTLRREALSLLFELYWGHVYCYRIEAGEVIVRPVYSDHWRAVYGDPVEIQLLDCDIVYLEPPFKGVFSVANFGGRYSSFIREFDPLQNFYDLLGVGTSADEDEIKHAYRKLARKYHPDANPSPEANTMMQRINEAYEKIMERLKA